jgi:hypothetical protein
MVFILVSSCCFNISYKYYKCIFVLKRTQKLLYIMNYHEKGFSEDDQLLPYMEP